MTMNSSYLKVQWKLLSQRNERTQSLRGSSPSTYSECSVVPHVVRSLPWMISAADSLQSKFERGFNGCATASRDNDGLAAHASPGTVTLLMVAPGDIALPQPCQASSDAPEMRRRASDCKHASPSRQRLRRPGLSHALLQLERHFAAIFNLLVPAGGGFVNVHIISVNKCRCQLTSG